MLKKNLLWQGAAIFLCMRSSLLESIIVTEFHATEARSSLDLASVDCLRWKRKMVLCELPRVISVHAKKVNRNDDENEVYKKYEHPNS
jgi:hypothetical protein